MTAFLPAQVEAWGGDSFSSDSLRRAPRVVRGTRSREERNDSRLRHLSVCLSVCPSVCLSVSLRSINRALSASHSQRGVRILGWFGASFLPSTSAAQSARRAGEHCIVGVLEAVCRVSCAALSTTTPFSSRRTTPLPPRRWSRRCPVSPSPP